MANSARIFRGKKTFLVLGGGVDGAPLSSMQLLWWINGSRGLESPKLMTLHDPKIVFAYSIEKLNSAGVDGWIDAGLSADMMSAIMSFDQSDSTGLKITASAFRRFVFGDKQASGFFSGDHAVEHDSKLVVSETGIVDAKINGSDSKVINLFDTDMIESITVEREITARP